MNPLRWSADAASNCAKPRHETLWVVDSIGKGLEPKLTLANPLLRQGITMPLLHIAGRVLLVAGGFYLGWMLIG